MQKTLKEIYIKKPKYIVITLAAFAIYYFIMRDIVLFHNSIILFNSTFSEYIFYIIAVTSSILITIAVYAAFNTRNNRTKISAPASTSAVAVVGSFAVSCGCSFSMLSYLAVLGISSASITSLDGTIATYQTPLLVVALIINVVLIGYYLDKLSNPFCKIPKKKFQHNRTKR